VTQRKTEEERQIADGRGEGEGAKKYGGEKAWPSKTHQRDPATRRIFWGFCRNWLLIDPLHYLSSRSDFGFEFAEIFVIEKRLSDLPCPFKYILCSYP
jgi:hypothetical protein